MLHVPEGFLQLCLRFEYFKRNPASIARTNVHEMLGSTLENLVFPELRPKFTYNPPPLEEPEEEEEVENEDEEEDEEDEDEEEEEAPGPLKREHSPDSGPSTSSAPPSKKRKTSSEDEDEEESIGPVEPDPDPDSDNFETNEMEFEPGDANETGQCTLNKVRFLYENFANYEFWVLKSLPRDATPEECLGVMAAHRITKPHFIPILSTFVSDEDKFKVLTGYRKMSMSFECHVLKGPFRMSISYMSCQDGCLIWYGDTMRIIKKWKYQSVAAKDFFYLAKDPEMVFRILEFDVEKYRKFDPAVWPFSSFHQKIHKYLENTQLIVEKFNMTVFNDEASTTCGQQILEIILRHLKPENLKKLALRMWNATEVIKKRDFQPDEEELLSILYDDIHWKYIKTLDINDPGIRIHRNSFSRFLSFDNVNGLKQNDFGPLVQAYARIEDFGHHLSSFHVDEQFDFHVAHSIFMEEFGNEIAKMDDTKPEYKEYLLRNGVKIMFQEVQRIVQFLRELKR